MKKMKVRIKIEKLESRIYWKKREIELLEDELKELMVVYNGY